MRYQTTCLRGPVCTLAFAALLVAESPPHAQEAEQDVIDVVVLTSGNRMTGEVVELSRGELTFAIDGAGPVEIDWNNVEALESSRILDVQLASGERLSGSIASTSAGRLEVTADAGPRALEMENVVRIEKVGADFLERTSGAVDGGFDFLSANDEIDWTLNAEAENRTRNYLTEASLYSLVRRLDDATAQRRNRFQIASRRFLSNRWFVIGKFEAEEDRELDLDSRLLLGAGAGRTLMQSNRTIVALYAGLDYTHEQFREIAGTDRSTEAFATVEWDWFEIGGHTELTTAATIYFSLDRSRRRGALAASLRREIFGNLYWSLSLYQSYDSDPPGDLENSGLGLAITIGREF